MIKVFRLRIGFIVYGILILGVIYGLVSFLQETAQKKSIETLSTALVGKLIVIDPGHGGKDTGARSSSGTFEKDITLEISKRLGVMLGQAGAAVILTRDCDMWLADPNAPHKKRSDLTRRVKIANENKADAFISIHVNSYVYDRSQRGAQTFSQPGQEDGKQLSESIQKELSRILKNTNRKPKQIDYFIRHSQVPAVIIEMGFLSNSSEEKLLLDSVYQSKAAYAIYCGLVKYFAEMDAGNQTDAANNSNG